MPPADALTPVASHGRVTHEGVGVPGILVSDSRHVVRSADDGSFALPGHGRFVTITRPTGFDTPSWYLPAGPDLHFELFPQAQHVPFTFAQVTDLHVSLGSTAYGEGQGDATLWLEAGELHERVVTSPAVLDTLLTEVAARRPDFIVATGDLTNTGADGEFAAYVTSIERSDVPVVSLPGNHDHMAAEPGAFPYERYVGPRWFSFDYGGVHFVAIDWFTWRLRIDHEDQEAWLANDLAAASPELPVVLLSHDQMDSAFFDRMARRPIASFSGHWHTTRVVEHAGTVHYNTGTAIFGGLDYAPAHYRLATWDGQRLDVRTIVRGPDGLSGATMRSGGAPASQEGLRWSRGLSGAVHLAAPIVVGDAVLVASRQEDRAGGTLECLAAADGAVRWAVRLASAVKVEPLVVDRLAIVSSVSGETLAVDVRNGDVRWRTQVDDPLRPWVHLRPATDGTLVFVGDVGCFAALDLQDGAIVWTRSDLGERENLTSFSHPAVTADTLVVGFAGQSPPLWGLDPRTGATRWPDEAQGRSIYSGSQEELALGLPRVVMSAITPDSDGDDAYLMRLGSTLERFDARTGRLVWSAPCSGWFNPAAPVVAGDAVIATEGSGRLFCFGRDGVRRWVSEVGKPAPLAMGSYRADGPVMLAPPTPVGDRLLLPTGDGRIVAIDPADGAATATVDLGVPVTARLASCDEIVLAAGVDGVLRAVTLDRLGCR
jgi:outer membrane protein assembly factor BamB